jgi:peroxiredoxin (alkyl hydroperoxide reductase subunit C)
VATPRGHDKEGVLTMGEQTQTGPRIDELAPDFEATTTHGPIRLSDHRGKWVILFSHPADFTPVCTTEFMAFARLHDQFAEKNCQVIGLSIDSIHSHIAWVRNIDEKFGIKIPFPVIADLDMKVAHLYGMVQPGASTTSAVRCVFFIDPMGVLRAMVYYPLSNGRNFDEILRLLTAMQTSDAEQVATPADWRPGDKVIVPPPRTQDGAEKRVTEGYECVDWYFCKREL